MMPRSTRGTLAIAHVPSPRMEEGLRTHVARVAIDHRCALREHAEYCRTLREAGANVSVLDLNQDQPDCVFIEDTAIVLDEVAVLASMGAESRRVRRRGLDADVPVYVLADVQRGGRRSQAARVRRAARKRVVVQPARSGSRECVGIDPRSSRGVARVGLLARRRLRAGLAGLARSTYMKEEQ